METTMIDKLKQLEDKMMYQLLENPAKWNYIRVDEPLTEKCIANVGNYSINLFFSHSHILFDVNPIPTVSNSAVHVWFGSYEVHTNNFMYVAESLQSYYSFSAGTPIYFKPTGKEVCAMVSLEDIKMDVEGIEQTKEDENRKNIMLGWFKGMYVQKVKAAAAENVIKSMPIERGQWVYIDDRVSGLDTKAMNRFMGLSGFVIKREGDLVDVRFGTERVQLKSKFLKVSGREVSVNTSSGMVKKKVDDMNADNWD